MNVNRLLVVPTDSHVTEERRIEDRMVEMKRDIRKHTQSMRSELTNSDWVAAGRSATAIRDLTSEMWVMDQRLQDVKDINAQFARLQEHTDRLDAQLKENEGCS